MKRKLSDSGLENGLAGSTPKRPRRALVQANGTVNGHAPTQSPPNDTATYELPPNQSTPKKSNSVTATPLKESGLKTPTHKSRAKNLFATPTKPKTPGGGTPARLKNADRSAKKKSARVLFEQDDDAEWDGSEQLAAEILQEDEEDDFEPVKETGNATKVVESVEGEGDAEKPKGKDAKAPKRRAGRPKGAKNKRSPTPEGELPAHERYFFQNRAGTSKTSNKTLIKVPLLTHEEYFEKLGHLVDPCKEEKDYLLTLHHRSFSQWNFEFEEGYNICLYGYGSKRKLVQGFADWVYQHSVSDNPPIVIVNGYTPGISIRSIFAMIVAALLGDDLPSKLGSQPTEVLELLQSALSNRPIHEGPVTVLINSVDAPPLRRATNQALLARLAATPRIRLLVTADTPNFTVMWDISLRDQLNFLFHDGTTFTPFAVESDVVDEVNGLLGRKGQRVGGKDGVGFVLKSLPENARNLYRLLLTEVITIMDDGHQSDDEGGADNNKAPDDHGIEFRLLYQKATEEFIASSEMMFRTLLKEFHDHQMITSRMDPSGVEILGVPLSRDEMEGVLEDLVLG
ncbi:hypothetical protein N7478_005567 [Penicillium angulare]|uniref:uncharacterized protein n=1 Tax=Penicillium angulare TaxID=116970 RepID=UPI00253FB761|nr:uncharacterized protein N7478_005567 [Penicillium angulare]KAJ5280195.1 hypothetical protein N7478_005567 [Penicillium angulare]